MQRRSSIMKKLFFFAASLCFFSCDKNKYSEGELWRMAQRADPKIELLIPQDMQSGVQCADYGGEAAGCIMGKRVKLRKVVAIIVQFETQEQARAVAEKYQLYYKYNWVFDDVAGEPVLESFVESVFGAMRPQ